MPLSSFAQKCSRKIFKNFLALSVDKSRKVVLPEVKTSARPRKCFSLTFSLVSKMMTSAQIRQSFLDFFKSKQHTIVRSSPLDYKSRDGARIFTNAGMNQFVPIFLGEEKPEVNKWADCIPGLPTRAADTQKCIRATGKHNDLDDVGLDTYHHTFFEMLGNWSFGDYFKREAIDWAWKLVVEKWKFPPQRIYATVFSPHFETENDRWQKALKTAVEFAEHRISGGETRIATGEGEGVGAMNYSDAEAASFWAEHFLRAGIDPFIHIVPGNRKDNFWMMGETGPCGPCSELHVDLTSENRALEMEKRGATLVNKGDARCIEIWNLVFIQFNANPDGTFSPLPAKHVDTGMGFERVTSIIQGTKNFSDFANAKISNYETDIFRPIFDELKKLSGKKYTSTLPQVPGCAVEMGSATVPVASVGVPPTESARETGTSLSIQSTSHAPGAAARDAQQGDRDGRAPQNNAPHSQEQVQLDIAFRVIADHIRTLGFAIADGIQPGNNDRNYVLRRILRRAVRYGRTLGFHEPFFYKLVDVLADTMGDVFPEIRARKKQVQETIQREEEAFNKTLDAGIHFFEEFIELQLALERLVKFAEPHLPAIKQVLNKSGFSQLDLESVEPYINQISVHVASTNSFLWEKIAPAEERDLIKAADSLIESVLTLVEGKVLPVAFDELAEKMPAKFAAIEKGINTLKKNLIQFRGAAAFVLYDTYGFPLDLTELMARERGLTVDKDGFEKLMEEQRARARAAQKKEVISLSQIETTAPTKFVGFEKLESPARVLEVVSVKDKTAVVLDTSPFYAEMGGQVGDTGMLFVGNENWDIVNTQKSGNTWLHILETPDEKQSRIKKLVELLELKSKPSLNAPEPMEILAIGSDVRLSVNRTRRRAIERHHTVTHLLHWALHQVVSKEASQKGSFVGPDKLTFDFNSAPLTPAQVADIEELVNKRILENAGVSWTEVAHADVKNRKDVMQFFGDKYGDTVRVVQIGGHAGKLDGYSMELCGGTHTRATGEIGLFRIVAESAIAAGVRRIEAVAGIEAYKRANDEVHLIKNLAGKVNSPVHELDKKIESLLVHQKELEKQIKAAQQREASNAASGLLERVQTVNGIPAIIHNVGAVDGDFLQAIADSLKGRFKGAIVLGGAANGAVSLVAAVSPEFTSKIQAEKIIQTIAPIVSGKGGGKPDNARGGGKDAGKLDEALAKAAELLKS
jgi:alanyl-tRNA synthetase